MKLNQDETVESKAPRNTTKAERTRMNHVCQHVENGACTRCMYPMRVTTGVRSFSHSDHNPDLCNMPSPSILLRWKKLLNCGFPLCRLSS